MYKILISGYYGFHNIGDEAVLRCVTQRLRAALPETEITILSNDPEDTREKYHVASIPRMNLRKVFSAIRKTDMLISGGGSLLQDVTSRFSILYYLTIIFLALLFHKRVFIYSQGIGPIHGKLNRHLTGFLLRRADGIAVRDEKSARLLTEIGVPEDGIVVTADPVLGLNKADSTHGREQLEALGLSDARPLVGWAIRAGDDRFLSEITRSVQYLKETYNADSIFIPFHFEQDAAVIEALSQRLGTQAHYITDKYLIDDMLSLIGNLDLLIGVRLHSLIYAAVSEVPMVGISYDPKIDAFLDSISCPCISSVEDFTLEKLAPVVEPLLTDPASSVAQTNQHVTRLRQRLAKNEEMIISLVHPRQETAKKKGGVASVIGGVMLITILAKVFGILRESVQASVFGALDAYYAAYNKTIYLFTTAAYAMCIAAVPIITREMEKSRRDGEQAANNLTTISLLFSLIALGLWELFTLPPFAGLIYGDDGAVIPFVRIMALSLPVIVAAYLMVALFQSLDHFSLQGSMSLPHSLFLIIYLVLFGKRDSVLTYVCLVCVAWVLQFLMCVPYAIREKYRYRPRLQLDTGYLGSFVKTSVVTIVASSTYLFCYLMDASTAEALGEGTTTAFYYADKLFPPLATTFIYSISAVMFPKLNREYTHSAEKSYKKYVWSITSSTLVVVMPLCAMLMVFGGPILKVLFESGNFTPEVTTLTTEIFVVYVLGMAGFAAMDLVNKAFFTMGRSLAPLLVSLGTMGLNLLLNHFFGTTGTQIALTTALSMTFGGALTMLILFRKEHIVSFLPVLKSLLASLVVGLVAGGLKGLLVSMSDGKLMLIIKCGGIGIVSLIVFLLMCILLRLDVVTDALKQLKNNN